MRNFTDRKDGRKAAGRRPQGEAQILRRQLTRRFGPLPDWVEAKLSEASTDTLELWADRILDAATFEEVFSEQ